MNTRIRIAALATLSVAQLMAAGWSIFRYESILRSGTLYRIQTRPVDPADAFRGRYVAVRASITIAKDVAAGTDQLLERIGQGQRGYVLLRTGSDGFAEAAQVVATPPAQGDYLEIAQLRQDWSRDAGGEFRTTAYLADFAFDRYYMNEAAAPTAERRYSEAMARNAATRAWLTVRVKNGVGVIEGLYIDGVRIEELVALSRTSSLPAVGAALPRAR